VGAVQKTDPMKGGFPVNAMSSRIASFVPNVGNLAPMVLPQTEAAACVSSHNSCWCSTPANSSGTYMCTYQYCITCFGNVKEAGICWC
jgi:hypothetical protein